MKTGKREKTEEFIQSQVGAMDKFLGSNINNLLRQNKNIYLREGQLIVYKD